MPAECKDKALLRRNNVLPAALMLFLLLFMLVVIHLHGQPSFGVLKEDSLIQIPVDELEDNMLYITQGRRNYRRGEMTLIIPAIDIYTPVGESTTPEGLMEMPGLYEFSQLPSEGDNNVSIAGHRDIHDMVFLELDKLQDGDYFYLLYSGMVFRYLYRDTRIVRPDSWDVISRQGYSALTLTTCDPIGTTLNRLVVTAELEDWQLFDDLYQFSSSRSASAEADLISEGA